MHLRPPSIDHGITSFLWALFFGLFIWIGGRAVGFSGAVTFIGHANEANAFIGDADVDASGTTLVRANARIPNQISVFTAQFWGAGSDPTDDGNLELDPDTDSEQDANRIKGEYDGGD